MKTPEILKYLRVTKGMNKTQTAKELGMPYTTYVNYEAGTRDTNSDVLLLFADYYNVTVDYLLGRDAKEEQKNEPEYGSKEWLRQGLIKRGVTGITDKDLEVMLKNIDSMADLLREQNGKE